MPEWQSPPASVNDLAPEPTLHVLPQIRSDELQNYRDLQVLLPPAYGTANDRRWPVIYMQDGQNLFDAEASYAGDWGLRTTLQELARGGIEAIVVGIANTRGFRRFEYSPFRDSFHGGGDGDRYLAFVCDTVRPLINATFRTRPERDSTLLAGASMGGLVSLYAAWRRPEVFGTVAALSPSVWFAEQALVRLAETEPLPDVRWYMDVGTGELPAMVEGVRALRDALVAQGVASHREWRYVEDPGGAHRERDWGRRFRAALPWMLGHADATTQPPLATVTKETA